MSENIIFTPHVFAFFLRLNFGIALPKVKQVHFVLAGAKAHKQLWESATCQFLMLAFI